MLVNTQQAYGTFAPRSRQSASCGLLQTVSTGRLPSSGSRQLGMSYCLPSSGAREMSCRYATASFLSTSSATSVSQAHASALPAILYQQPCVDGLLASTVAAFLPLRRYLPASEGTGSAGQPSCTPCRLSARFQQGVRPLGCIMCT